MTNHIEELMKAAGVEEKTESYCKWECEKPALETSPICYDADCLFRKFRTFYPAFTPAKQLELIKLILKGSKTYNLELEYVGVCDHYCFSWFDATVTYDDCITVNNKCYELALAELVYTLINENKLNKSEVKRILEDD